MKFAAPRCRRTLLTAITAGGLTLASYSMATGPAAADPPQCTAANLAHTTSTVTNNVGNYLDAHADANTAFTNLKGLPRPQMRAQAEQYLSANPQVKSDLQGLREPLTDLAQQCGVTLPPGPLGMF